MQITNDWLVTHGACKGGCDWFNRTFTSGSASLESVLTALAEAAAAHPQLGYCYGWPCWVMSEVSGSALCRALGTASSWYAAKNWCLGSYTEPDHGAASLARLNALITRFMAEYQNAGVEAKAGNG